MVQQSGCHLGVAEDRGPFAKAEVGGDDDAGALIKLAQQVEEQRSAGGTEREVSQLVQDEQIEANQRLRNLARLAFGFLLLERID